jgi:hypothetical protein
MTSIATPNDLLAFLREKGGEPAPEAALAELNSPGTETAGRNVLRTFVSSAPAAAM